MSTSPRVISSSGVIYAFSGIGGYLATTALLLLVTDGYGKLLLPVSDGYGKPLTGPGGSCTRGLKTTSFFKIGGRMALGGSVLKESPLIPCVFNWLLGLIKLLFAIAFGAASVTSLSIVYIYWITSAWGPGVNDL